MISSPEDAIRLLSKWQQEDAHLFLMSAVAGLVLLTPGRVSEVNRGRLTIKAGDGEIRVLLGEPTFEYQEPREAPLTSLGLTEGNCVCCLSVTLPVEDILLRERLQDVPFAEATLLVCELRT